MRGRLRHGDNEDLLQMLEALGGELGEVLERRKNFIERPVAAPPSVEMDSLFMEGVANLANGNSAFGFKGLFGMAERKKWLEAVKLLGDRPSSAEEWEHVKEHFGLLRSLRELALRWNALAHELHIDVVPDDKPEGGLAAAQGYSLYLKVKNIVKAEIELLAAASQVFPNWAYAQEVIDNAPRLSELEKALRHHLTKNRLANVWAAKERCQKVLEGRTGRVIDDIRIFLAETLGNPAIEDARMQALWSKLMSELARVLGLRAHLATVRDVCNKVENSGAMMYATALKQPLESTVDMLLPDNWRKAWRLRRMATYLEAIDAKDELKKLATDRQDMENDLSRAYRDIVVKRTWLKLTENASPSIRAALQAYLNAIQKIGKGTGKRAVRYRQDARMAASLANPAVPCWIMPHYRVSESLPAELGCFHLVVVDEASQSDLNALPALLRAQKVLIVGDDKQVSPEGVGLEEEKVRSLMNRFLGSQVTTYRPQMSPERSIYDLFKVVFAKSTVMLKEHFRCVGPIIEYSKREFYNHELRPLRVPKASERLDPPLVDVLVQDGYRKGDINLPEMRFIVDEIKAIVEEPSMSGRSIGVVSLLADKQALAIWERLTDELGPEVMQRHRITCGDARTFQGKERDIMFLTMVSAPNEVGAPLSRDTFAQRFNVAASRAKDRMYLVRSVGLEHLSDADKLRRSLIAHFATPFAQDEVRVEDLRKLCESPFEREMYDELIQRGYWVTPQVRVGQYRIDMVVEGHDDARLAIECDGDRYHGADKWADDMQRQRVLERAGWVFWRCFASAFIRRRKDVMDDLLKALVELGIDPIGAEGAPRSVHSEHRVVSSTIETEVSQSNAMPVEISIGRQEPDRVALLPLENSSRNVRAPPEELRLNRSANDVDFFELRRVPVFVTNPQIGELSFSDYVEYSGPPGDDPRNMNAYAVSEGIVRIVEVEGPMIAKRAYDIYLRGCGIKRMGHELKSSMNKALSHAIGQGRVVFEDEAGVGGLVYSVVRLKGSPPIRLRNRGPRLFEEIPPSELQVVSKSLLKLHEFAPGSDEHLRAVLERFDLKRLTTQVGTILLEILEKDFSHVDEFLTGLHK